MARMPSQESGVKIDTLKKAQTTVVDNNSEAEKEIDFDLSVSHMDMSQAGITLMRHSTGLEARTPTKPDSMNIL
jgi:hypothetical protein